MPFTILGRVKGDVKGDVGSMKGDVVKGDVGSKAFYFRDTR